MLLRNSQLGHKCASVRFFYNKLCSDNGRLCLTLLETLSVKLDLGSDMDQHAMQRLFLQRSTSTGAFYASLTLPKVVSEVPGHEIPVYGERLTKGSSKPERSAAFHPAPSGKDGFRYGRTQDKRLLCRSIADVFLDKVI